MEAARYMVRPMYAMSFDQYSTTHRSEELFIY
jgi:hypothetical protein